ncbi:MAG: PhoH family protein [Planctomycetales bacterium]|nr:PhoH family protein [Planctomycetales bacterium]
MTRRRTPTDKKKLFVMDTNVILHDARCLHTFAEHDIAIPITVLEELDRFKKGQNDLNFQAREFLRNLDDLTGDLLSKEGAPLGAGHGHVRVVIPTQLDPRIREVFLRDEPDNRIVNASLYLSNIHPDHQVILVSKDTNIRLKAKALGLVAQDYIRDALESVDQLYRGIRSQDIESEKIDRFYGAELPMASEIPIESPNANENFILRSGSKSILAVYRPDTGALTRIDKTKCYGISPRNAEQTFALAALTDPSIKLVTLVGKAGTGKTLLALAAALQSRREYRQILLARPVVPLSNRDLGYLPGDVQDKLAPYMQPLHDNLNVIRNQFSESEGEGKKIDEMLSSEKLVITPLAYIRGRSLQKIFFIVDEAQNLTPHEVKTIITRAGEGTKIVFTGDIRQIDHPYLDSRSNGLSYLISRMVGQTLYSHITLEKGERSQLADLASELL